MSALDTMSGRLRSFSGCLDDVATPAPMPSLRTMAHALVAASAHASAAWKAADAFDEDTADRITFAADNAVADLRAAFHAAFERETGLRWQDVESAL